MTKQMPEKWMEQYQSGILAIHSFLDRFLVKTSVGQEYFLFAHIFPGFRSFLLQNCLNTFPNFLFFKMFWANIT